MTESELIEELNKLKINPRFYSLDEELKEYAFNIKKTHDNFFAVFYLERGEVINSIVFKTKEEAFNEILSLFKEELNHGTHLS